MMKRGATIVCDGKKVAFSGNVGPAKPYDAAPGLGLKLRRVFARGGVWSMVTWASAPKSDEAELPRVANQSVFHKWTLRVKYDLVEEPENAGVEIFLHLDADTFLPESRTIKKFGQIEETYTTLEVDGAVAESEFELFK